MARRAGGVNPIIAGGAIRDFTLRLGDPKDIDVFLGGNPNEDFEMPRGWQPIPRDDNVHDEYRGIAGHITAIQDWRYEFSDHPVQFVWLGNQDPVQYVRGFDLGTSKCYYRGSVVLGKDFLNDWHHQQITILPAAFENGHDPERSRARAQRLRARYPNGAAIIERPPEPLEPRHIVVGRNAE